MECVCRTAAVVASTEYGHTVRILLHPVECDLSGDMDAGSSWPCTLFSAAKLAEVKR